MKYRCIKYYLTLLLFCIVKLGASQMPGNNATVTIIGDPVAEIQNANFANNNLTSAIPPEKREFASPQNIAPTLENGFYIRYEIKESRKMEERPAATGYEYTATTLRGDEGGVKLKKRHTVNITEKSFNMKKKLKTWMPKRKKKYRPHLCGRFS